MPSSTGNIIQLFHSRTASNVPGASSLVDGELAINIADGKLYYKDTSSNVKLIASVDGSGLAYGILNVDNLRLDGNTLSSTDTNGNITLSPNGTGLTRAVNAGDAILRAERTGATATTADLIARNGYGEIRTSAGSLVLIPANKTIYHGAVDGPYAVIESTSSTTAVYPRLDVNNYSANGGFPVVELRNAKGTLASALDIGDATVLGGFNTWGWGGTTKGWKSTTRIEGVSRNTFATDATVSAAIDFKVTNGNVQSTAFRADFDRYMYFYRGAVINEDGADSDTRIEGDNDVNLIYVDASADSVGVGISTPSRKLHVQSTTATTNAVTQALRIDSQSSGTPANGIGVGMEFVVETAAGNNEIGATIEAITTDVTATSEDFDIVFRTMGAGGAAAERVRISSNTTSTSTTTGALIVTGGVGVSGALNATTKSFIIDHPTKPGKLLKHGSLEGPEFGVYVRGRSKSKIIELPEYWTGLVHEDSITVDLTPVGRYVKLYVEKIEENRVYVECADSPSSEVNYFYTVYAERKDVDKLEVEE